MNISSRKISCFFVAMFVSYATTGPATAQTAAKPSLTLDAARRILKAAEREAEQHNWPSTIAVADASGELLVLERMEGARAAGAYLAPGKARTAVVFRHPTKDLEETINNGRTAQVTAPGFVQMEGGVPVTIDGQVVGAIGVSGENKQQDSQIATAGVTGLNKAGAD
jgi:glc operon protein GlcG